MSSVGPLHFDDSWSHLPRGATARLRAPWHEGAVTSLALSRDASLACSAGADGYVKVWDLLSGELRWHFERPARKVILAPDGRTAWAIDEGFNVWGIDLRAGDVIGRVWAPPRRVLRGTRPESAALSPDGRWLLATCGDHQGIVRVIDLTVGRALDLIAPGAGELHPIGNFTADASSVRVMGGVRAGRMARARSAVYTFSLATGEVDRVRALRFSAAGPSIAVAVHRQQCVFGSRWIMVADGKRTLARWDAAIDEPVAWIELPVDALEMLTTSEETFASAFASDSAVLWCAHDALEEPTLRLLPERERAAALCLSADERVLLVGTSSGRVAHVALRARAETRARESL